MPPVWSGTHVWPSSSEYEILTVSGDRSVNSLTNTRAVWRSVNPIGSESINWEVGARRFTQFACPLEPKVTNSASRSDLKLTTPVFQFAPIDGSTALRPKYSTVKRPELVCVIVVKTPGALKFSYPTFGPA